jgi:F-type H+-transporting ATPase subunit delta
MPAGHDEASSIARVYAEAMMSTTTDPSVVEAVAAELAELTRYMDTDPDFERFLTATTVDQDARRDSLEKLFRGKLSDTLLNALLVMNHRNRLTLIRPFSRAVQLIMEERRNEQEVVVETAVPLTDDLRAGLKQVIASHIQKEVLLIERLRPELIGGMILHINDIQVDGSVLMHLQTMGKRLSHRATLEIHGGRGFVTED